MEEYIIRIVASFIGSFCFSIFFNMKKERLLHAAILGTLSCVITIYCEIKLPGNVFLWNLIPAMICTFLSELSARWKKAPAIIFILPSIIVLIPGGSFYYTMSYMVSGEQALFREWCRRTVQSALGIALGIMVSSFVFYEILSLLQYIKSKQNIKN